MSEATYQDWGTYLNLYVPDWGMGLPDRAFVFVDNHDNQRGHGGAGPFIKPSSLVKCLIMRLVLIIRYVVFLQFRSLVMTKIDVVHQVWY